ncbi:thiolase family protein [Stieleria varia]|uniref:Acetyl-CoA acetyltransferase n=1 Tax=Stieleria varia TaxID=2528005 RepID=A0A5C6AEK0_9BACT|nr:thiolase family protein [Stieleria varia]TWT98462.1 Acetyl-CoA acetyltransferase [Stieleria varia]
MNKPKPLAVISGARTPLAKAFTVLQDVSAVDLGVHAVTSAVHAAAVQREGFSISDIDEVVMGNVAGPADAANIARVIALKSGHPIDRIAHTVNRNCASGMESVLDAWTSISSGRARLAVAGGTESMSQIPMLVSPSAAKRWMQLGRSKTMWQRLKTLASFRPSDFKPVIGVQLGLTDPVSGLNMGETAEVLASEFAITRADQDEYALMSHQKAAAAQEKCFLSGEITPLQLGDRDPIRKDNGPRANQSMEQLAKLRPIFDRNGTVTAGNSCPLTDGAAALVLTDVENAKSFPAPLGYVTDYAIAGCDPSRMGLGPVFATAKLFKQSGYTMRDFDLIEINEAFAAQVIACERAAESKSFAAKELGMDSALGTFAREKTNVHGGAIALGHPVGTTGTRLILTLLRALKASGGRRGLATLCVGGGQGVAIVVQTDLEMN